MRSLGINFPSICLYTLKCSYGDATVTDNTYIFLGAYLQTLTVFQWGHFQKRLSVKHATVILWSWQLICAGGCC